MHGVDHGHVPGLMIKNLPANAGDAKNARLMPGWGNPLEKKMAAHSSILAWEIRWTEEPVELYSIRSQKTGIQFRTQFSSIQLLTHIQLFAIPQTVARQASLSITNSGSLLKLMSIESIMPSNHLILCRPLLLLPSIVPSIRGFSSESVHIMRPKYWSLSFNISPSNEHSGLISFRLDWLQLLAVQGTLKSPL